MTINIANDDQVTLVFPDGTKMIVDVDTITINDNLIPIKALLPDEE